MTYHEFIQNIITERGQWNLTDQYSERHHIIPKCLGGSDNIENLIDLFPREHFIAHKLLAQENPHNSKLIYAYHLMSCVKNEFQQERYILTPEEYEEARIAYRKMLVEKFKDKKAHPNYGKHLSKETKKKISMANKGTKACVGRVLSEETKKKIGMANSNPSSEKRKKMSEAQKARNLNGGNNPRAKKVMRVSDGKIYECMKEAAIDNNINYSTFKAKIYRDWSDFIFIE